MNTERAALLGENDHNKIMAHLLAALEALEQRVQALEAPKRKAKD